MTHEYKHYIDLSMFSPSDGFPEPLDPAKSANRILAYARELEARVKELEIRDVSATHMIMDADFKKHEMSLRIADLERQLAEAKSCGDNLRRFVGDYPDELQAQEDWIKLWLPLPETRKEDV